MANPWWVDRPGTLQSVDNSASGVGNHYPAHDVTWYKDVNFGGGSYCVDSDYAASLGFLDNDTYSSHRLLLNDGVC